MQQTKYCEPLCYEKSMLRCRTTAINPQEPVGTTHGGNNVLNQDKDCIKTSSLRMQYKAPTNNSNQIPRTAKNRK
jgi:hypothetical protein